MAKYARSTKNRTSFPDRSLLMSAYVKINIGFPDKADLEIKKNNLNELTYLISNVLHRDIESDISIREGSVIAEIISSGNLSTLLSPENLKAIGVSILKGDVTDTLLTYATVRAAVNTLAKDIKTATATLSMAVRSVFGARLGDVARLEARTGVIGSFQRFFDACDVATNERLSAKKRKNALERAEVQIVAIDEICQKTEDIDIATKYITRELGRIKPIKKPAPKEEKDAQQFNDLLLHCNKLMQR